MVNRAFHSRDVWVHPAIRAAYADDRGGRRRLWNGRRELVLKLELLQHTGSFKPRGAFANMLAHRIPAREWWRRRVEIMAWRWRMRR